MPREPISLGLRSLSGDDDSGNTPREKQPTEAEVKEKLRTLSDELKKVIFGQDRAIDALTSAIHISHAGLRKKDRLVGSFLFLGPTGSGKTEVTIQLAQQLGYKFLRIDMSEFKHSHQIARLIGSPPGYIGAEIPGQLTSFVAQHPRCVILLDEIEKAHPDAFDLLLQVMDYAKLTDGKNRSVDFSRAILVMTSNLGVADRDKKNFSLQQQAPAAGRGQNHEARMQEAVRRVFSPEFRNRLDEVIEFQPLPLEVIVKIVDKFTAELADQLKKKNVAISLTQEAKVFLAENGFDKKMGARPLDRFITREIRKKVAPEVLFGKLEFGGEVAVDVAQDPGTGKKQLSFAFNSAARPEPKPEPPKPVIRPPSSPSRQGSPTPEF